MEEWHQKLHNNSTPDDIIICEVYEPSSLLLSSLELSDTQSL